MTAKEIVAEVKGLGLPEGTYVVFGSCPMAAVGIREANDIDILMTPDVYRSLLNQGWRVLDKGPKDQPVIMGRVEAHPNWEFSPYSPTLEQLLSTAMNIDGIPFASLEEVRKWKKASGIPKHDKDIELIDKYLASA